MTRWQYAMLLVLQRALIDIRSYARQKNDEDLLDFVDLLEVLPLQVGAGERLDPEEQISISSKSECFRRWAMVHPTANSKAWRDFLKDGWSTNSNWLSRFRLSEDEVADLQ